MFQGRYSFGASFAASPDDVREAAEVALRGEGFGVLTEIDMAATMRAKLGLEMEPYVILGACNPAMAQRAVTADPSIGTLLPCNVVIRAVGGTTVLEVMDPEAVLALVGMDEVGAVAREVSARLHRAVDRVGELLPQAGG